LRYPDPAPETSGRCRPGRFQRTAGSDISTRGRRPGRNSAPGRSSAAPPCGKSQEERR